MRLLNFLALLMFVFLACNGGGRPAGNDEFTYTITGTSILKSATIHVLDSDKKEIKSGATDEDGVFKIEDVKSATGIVVEACGGSFYSASTGDNVAFSGCLETAIDKTEKDVLIVVDFLSKRSEYIRCGVLLLLVSLIVLLQRFGCLLNPWNRRARVIFCSRLLH